MTIILAAALKECAVLVADSFQHHLADKIIVQVDKTHVISPHIVGGKFGYSNGAANSVWSELKALPLSDRTSIHRLLDQTVGLGKPIYEECRALFADNGEGDYGLTFIFASWDETNGSGIHWIDFKNGDGIPNSVWYRDSAGIQVLAVGPDGSQSIATECARSNFVETPPEMRLDIGLWAAETIANANQLPGLPLGLPAYSRIVDNRGDHHHLIDASYAAGDLVHAV